jgi:hypothetical protein
MRGGGGGVYAAHVCFYLIGPGPNLPLVYACTTVVVLRALTRHPHTSSVLAMPVFRIRIRKDPPTICPLDPDPDPDSGTEN